MSLLSDEEVRKLTEEVIQDNAMEAFEFAKKLLEAQHAKDQKRIEQVFEGLEELFEPTVPMTLDYEKYHQYKTRTLAKIKEE